MTTSASTAERTSLAKRRFDVLLGQYLNPLAAIEGKIGVRSANKLTKDADKMLTAITRQDRMRSPMLGALVFEIHVVGNGKVAVESDFNAVFTKLYNTVQTGLSGHIAAQWPAVTVSFHVLAEAVDPADIVNNIIETDGAASFICAAILTTPPRFSGAGTESASDTSRDRMERLRRLGST